MISRSLCLACLALLILSPITTNARPSSGVRSSGGFSRPSAPSYRPITQVAAPASTRTFGGTTPFAYSRPGYRSTPLFLPFAAGALVGHAAYSLNSDRNAYCNGVSIQCYKNTCQQALSQCQDNNSTELVTAPCPDPRFSECWQSTDQGFQCFGTRRPRFGDDDVVAYCNQPEGNSAGSTQVHLVLMGALALVAVLVL